MVLKKNEVRLTDPCRIGQDAPEVRPTATALARVIARDDAGTTVEVTCSCGRKVQLRCLYVAETVPAET